MSLPIRKNNLVLSQRKYALDLLQEAGLLGCKPESTPVIPNPDFWDGSSEIMEDPGRYRRLIGKLIYLTVTRPDIAYVIGLMSQFMHEPRVVHWTGALRVLVYIKGVPEKSLLFEKHGHLNIEAFSDSSYTGDKTDRKSTSSYCTYVGGNLIT